MTMSPGISKGIPNGSRPDGCRDSPPTTGQLSDSLGSSGFPYWHGTGFQLSKHPYGVICGVNLVSF